MDLNAMSDEYVDLNDAVSRIGGNTSLYKRLLSRFLEGNHYEAIKSALQTGDMEEAARQAHSLKGVSANLSLVKIRAITVELEQLIKDNADYAASLAELEQAFSATTEKISEILNQAD